MTALRSALVRPALRGRMKPAPCLPPRERSQTPPRSDSSAVNLSGLTHQGSKSAVKLRGQTPRPNSSAVQLLRGQSSSQTPAKLLRGETPLPTPPAARIQDPGNLGTILRTAAGLGWTGVFLLGGGCDAFNDKAPPAGPRRPRASSI